MEEVDPGVDAVEKTQMLFPDTIKFSNEALRGAKKLNFNRPDLLFKILVRMASDLSTIVYRERNPNYVEEFKLRTGFEISNEGSSTRKDAVIKRARTVAVDGESFTGWLHIKYGIREPDMIRVYFAFDNAKKRIVVTHIATHLRASGSAKDGGRRN